MKPKTHRITKRLDPRDGYTIEPADWDETHMAVSNLPRHKWPLKSDLRWVDNGSPVYPKPADNTD
jgi:hypothetical protein